MIKSTSDFIIPLLTGGLLFLMALNSHAESMKVLQASLPMSIGDWRADLEDQVFDSQSIFSYINGAGEVYRAYNMQTCLSRTYRDAKGSSIVLDVFDMGSSEDAFGIFTHDRDGESLAVGQDGLFRPGWVSFWKDRFFVSITMEEDTPDSQRVAKELAALVSSLIRREGQRPAILELLPEDGVLASSVRYLHHPIVLNYHFYLSNENILRLGPKTPAVLAEYVRSKAEALLLLVAYPNEAEAEKAFRSFLDNYLPEAGPSRIYQLEDGKWCAASLRGRLLCVVLQADTKEIAEELPGDSLRP